MILLIISYLFKNMNLDNFDNYKFSDKLSIQNINNLKKSQIKMTDMLREFNRICRKYNLKYWCDWEHYLELLDIINGYLMIQILMFQCLKKTTISLKI